LITKKEKEKQKKKKERKITPPKKKKQLYLQDPTESDYLKFSNLT